jgi:hypothetical protein
MPSPLPPFANEWMAQWRHAAVELPKIRASELRALTEQQVIAAAISLEPQRPYELRTGSGMVEMQRVFSRVRENEMK